MCVNVTAAHARKTKLASTRFEIGVALVRLQCIVRLSDLFGIEGGLGDGSDDGVVI